MKLGDVVLLTAYKPGAGVVTTNGLFATIQQMDAVPTRATLMSKGNLTRYTTYDIASIGSAQIGLGSVLAGTDQAYQPGDLVLLQLNAADVSGGGGGSGNVNPGTTNQVASYAGAGSTVSGVTLASGLTISGGTLQTSITGLMKGSSGAIVAAAAGTDFQGPVTLTTTGTGGAATFNATTGALNVPNYAAGSGTPLTSLTALQNVSTGLGFLVNDPLNTTQSSLGTTSLGTLDQILGAPANGNAIFWIGNIPAPVTIALPLLLTGTSLGASVFVASGTSHATGIVPDPGASAGTTRFLREDATWDVPAGATAGFTLQSLITTPGSAVTNSTTPASFIAGSSTYSAAAWTIAASRPAVGTKIWIEARGYYTGNATVQRSVRVVLGSTTVCNLVDAAMVAPAQTAAGWRFRATIDFQTVGTSGTVDCDGEIQMGSTSAASVVCNLKNTGGANTPTTVNTTGGSLLIDIQSAQITTGSSAESFTCTGASWGYIGN